MKDLAQVDKLCYYVEKRVRLKMKVKELIVRLQQLEHQDAEVLIDPLPVPDEERTVCTNVDGVSEHQYVDVSRGFGRWFEEIDERNEDKYADKQKKIGYIIW
jgi:hypothetical protein